MSSAPPEGFLTRANPPPPLDLISGSVTLTAAAAATAASAALPPARYASAAASAAYGVPAAAAKGLLGPIVSIIGYDTPAGTLAERVRILREERSGGRRFNSATNEEIMKADVADSYFHTSMRGPCPRVRSAVPTNRSSPSLAPTVHSPSTRPRYWACSARPPAWPRGRPAAGSPLVRGL